MRALPLSHIPDQFVVLVIFAGFETREFHVLGIKYTEQHPQPVVVIIDNILYWLLILKENVHQLKYSAVTR